MNKNEIRRLVNGIDSNENINDINHVEFIIKCNNNSVDVLSKFKEVLKVVLEYNENTELTIDEWRNLLPQWFISKCAKEISKEEAEKRLELSIDERIRNTENEGWTLSGWIYWFNPQERQWYFWDAKIMDCNTIHLVVECPDLFFAWGALRWLCKACGALDCEEE